MIGIKSIADKYILEYINHDVLGNGALINERPLMCLYRPLYELPLYEAEALNAPLYLSNAHKEAFSPTLGITALQ